MLLLLARVLLLFQGFIKTQGGAAGQFESNPSPGCRSPLSSSFFSFILPLFSSIFLPFLGADLPLFPLLFSVFLLFLGADLPFQLCLILEDRTTYHSMSTTPFRQNEKKYSSKSIHFSRVVYLAPTDSTCPSTGLLKTINLSHFSSTSMDGLNTQVSLN